MDQNQEEDHNNQLYTFVKMAPKIELHAHLSGCVRRSTLEEFAKEKNLVLDFSCFDRKDNEGQFNVFGIISQTIKTLSDYKRVTKEMLEDFKSQNVVYLEIRTTPKDCEKGTYTMEDYINTIISVIQQHNEEENQTMQARLLLSIDRGRSQEHSQKVLDHMIRLRDANPYLVGIDFAGNPEKGSFKDFANYFLKCKQMGIKTTIHAGVIEGEEVLRETKEILEFQPDRVGHFNYFNDELKDLIIQKKIPIELCPTSNYFTKGLTDMKQHHFKDYFYAGHTVSLSTDDTGVFDTNSTEEHLKMIKTFQLTVLQFKQLLLLAPSMIFDDQIKNSLTSQIEEYFNKNSEIVFR